MVLRQQLEAAVALGPSAAAHLRTTLDLAELLEGERRVGARVPLLGEDAADDAGNVDHERAPRRQGTLQAHDGAHVELAPYRRLPPRDLERRV
eukprot:929552-Prymnesium_polylepis.1